MPPADSLLARPTVWITRLAIRAPKLVLATALGMALLSLLASAGWLRFRTSRLDLLDSRMSYNQRWLAYLDEFGDDDDVVVVVEGTDRAAVSRALADVAQRVRAEEKLFSSVLHHPDLSRLRGKALHYLPLEQLQALDALLAQLRPVLQGNWSQLNLARQLEWSRSFAAITGIRRVAWETTDTAPRVARTAEPSTPRLLGNPQAGSSPAAGTEALGGESQLAAALVGSRRSPTPWSRWNDGLEQLANRFHAGPLLAENGRQGFLLLRIAVDDDDFVRGRNAVARLREIVRQTRNRHPGVAIGITGMPVLETDEMATSQSDSTRSTLAGLAGVVLVLMAGFGGWRGPALAMATLLLGLAWSLGFATLAVGHLNILSASFGAILLGLGIDFGIHFFARYDQLRGAASDGRETLLETARSVGPGIVSGALTTALAFFAATLTHFRGVAELGIVAGGGLLLCLAAALVVLPALLQLGLGCPAPAARPSSLQVVRFCRPFLRHPVLTLAGALLAVGAAATGLPRLRYDHNLLHLQPAGLESVALERRLTEGSDRSVWCGLSVADTPTQLARLKARFESLEVVARTEEIASLTPPFDRAKTELVRSIHQRLGSLPERPPLIPVTPREELAQALGGLPAADGGGVLRHLLAAPDRDYFQRVSQVQQATATDVLRLLHTIRELSDPLPPQAADVPAELRDRHVGRHGRHLLKVYGKGSLWDMDALRRFVRAVESVDPRITGHPIQTFYASRQMQQSYVHAGIYAMFAVVIVVLLDLRSVRHTLLSLIPLALGMAALFGLLGLLDVPLNAANLIVLPLILGTGIDNGVHLVHDFREQRGGYCVSNSTACGILLCSATTMIGFASMMLSRHQGLQSLGLVLTLGMACCLAASLIGLPSVLALLRPASQPPGDVVP